MTVRHIYWFSYQGAELPSVRYRAVHPLQHLWAWHGVGSTFVVPGWRPQRVWRFLRAWCEALFNPRQGSVIVVQRLYTFGLYALALRLLTFFRGERCIYDIDDAEHIERPAGTINALMRSCALVTTGSAGLLTYARRYNPAGALLTSPVPDHGQHKATLGGHARRNDVFTIGWVGCFWGTHEANMHALLLPALRDLGFRAKLVVLGARNDEAEERLRSFFADDRWLQIEVVRDIDWCDEAAVHARIAEFDVGVSPLRDTEINRCKSAFKLKQYLSCGVPVLASPIGENGRFLVDGHNGFNCRSVPEFRAGIYRLAGMSDAHYARMSALALRSVHTFDLEHYASGFIDVCRTLRPFDGGPERHNSSRRDRQRPQRTAEGSSIPEKP